MGSDTRGGRNDGRRAPLSTTRGAGAVSATWFDSHCHLHICEEEGGPVDEFVSRARAVGVGEMVAVGIDVESSRRAVELTEFEGVVASAGVHPNSATEWTAQTACQIEDLLALASVRGVGETGLDFYRDWVAPDVQRKAFADHIELAKRSDKALIVHTRDSVDGVIEALKGAGPPSRLVFHCWSGDDAALQGALALGAYISFAGNVSFKSADALRHAAAQVPSDRLLVETDSPYLAPVPHRGKSNEPSFVPHVGEAVARARAEDVAAIAEVTTRNARTLFLP